MTPPHTLPWCPPKLSRASQQGGELKQSLAQLVMGLPQEKGVPVWGDSLSASLPEDGWRSRSVLPASSSAFGEVSEPGPGHPTGPGVAHPCPKQQPQCLGMAEICQKRLSAPNVQLRHSGLLLGVGKEAGEGKRYLKFFLRRGNICSQGTFLHGRAAGEQPGLGEKGAVVSQISLRLLP